MLGIVGKLASASTPFATALGNLQRDAENVNGLSTELRALTRLVGSAPAIDTLDRIAKITDPRMRAEAEGNLASLRHLLKALEQAVTFSKESTPLEFQDLAKALIKLKVFLASGEGYVNAVMAALTSACVSAALCDRCLYSDDDQAVLLGLAARNRLTTRVRLYAAVARETGVELPGAAGFQRLDHQTLLKVFLALRPDERIEKYVSRNGFPPIFILCPGANEDADLQRSLLLPTQTERLSVGSLICALPTAAQWDDVAAFFCRLAPDIRREQPVLHVSTQMIESICDAHEPPLAWCFTGKPFSPAWVRGAVASFDPPSKGHVGLATARLMLSEWNLQPSRTTAKDTRHPVH